jgi:hypothetical protein
MGAKPKHELTVDDLTAKQEKFAYELVANWGVKNKKDIVKEIYGEKGQEMTDSSASAIGSRLTNRKINPHVCMFIDQLKKEEEKKYKDKLRRHKRFEYYANKAAKKEQYASAINAEYRSGQMEGLFVDKQQISVTGLEGMSREELEKKLEELSKKIDGANAKTIEAKIID